MRFQSHDSKLEAVERKPWVQATHARSAERLRSPPGEGALDQTTGTNKEQFGN